MVGGRSIARGFAVVACVLLAGCGSAPKNASTVLDDLLRLFNRTSLDDVVRGNVDELDDVFRANRSTIDEAFQNPEFNRAVANAVADADPEVTSLASRFDSAITTAVDRRLKKMICEARLYAQNSTGDIEIFRPWVDAQFEEIEVYLTDPDVEEIAQWVQTRVNDSTSLYSLSCFAWARVV